MPSIQSITCTTAALPIYVSVFNPPPLPVLQAGYSEAERRKDPYDVTLFPAYRKRGSNLYKSSLHASMLAWGPE